MRIQELDRKYGKLATSEIEKKAADFSEQGTRSRRQFIEALYFLMSKQRYKENPLHGKKGFNAYLRGRWLMNESAFTTERKVYIAHPDAARKYGPGNIATMQRRCGALNTAVLIKALDKKDKVTQDIIDKLIEQYAKPKKAKASVVEPKVELERQIVVLKKTLAEKERTIQAQAEQIERLKETVRRYREIENAFVLHRERMEPAGAMV